MRGARPRITNVHGLRGRIVFDLPFTCPDIEPLDLAAARRHQDEVIEVPNVLYISLSDISQ
ncbi:hypothetical protein AADZ90_016045 [Aestuariibius sp. 2305UL40-4]|uniref:hypothetical protein n=1 Tax=Aestuariibius violaceus TaxID=3234132 RepID=UPI00345F0B2F